MAGEFYLLSQLWLRGLVGAVTFGNTKGVDILVSNPRTQQMFRVEVKATVNPARNTLIYGKNWEWRMSKKHEDIYDASLVYAFVYFEDYSLEPRVFLVPCEDVAKYCVWEHEEWIRGPHVSADVEKGAASGDRRFRISFADRGILAPYEDNWGIFEAVK